MKYLLLLLVLLKANTIFSQDGKLKNNRLQDLNASKPMNDSMLKALLQKSIITTSPDTSRMPIQYLANSGSFSYNNGKGHDVYIMKQDNMICVVPDSSFIVNMPGAASFKKRTTIRRP